MSPSLLSLFSLVRWVAILTPVAACIGTATAFFLWSLDAVTRVRFAQPGLLFLLPIGGLFIGAIYQLYGGRAARGNNLLIDEIHQPEAGVPTRMAPLVLLGTLVTHLFGGSAGREGTALQMGGSIAATFARMLKLDTAGVRLLLMSGLAAGFGSVFGTPVAGAIFALEILTVGRLQYDALLPCFFASLVADWTCRAWGIGHMHYDVGLADAGSLIEPWLMGKIVLAAIACGLVARLFVFLSHRLSTAFTTYIPRAEFRPFVGGLLVIGLYFLAGRSDFLGLGVLDDGPHAITLPAMFISAEIPGGAWAWKLVFTVVTLSAGFKGGEVTPLFFIGAALGNSMAAILGAPVDLFAAAGLVAIFAAATKTPIASIFLGMELFGAGNGLALATASVVATACSGPRSIYSAQRHFTSFLPPGRN